jgi:hypothetical protein
MIYSLSDLKTKILIIDNFKIKLETNVRIKILYYLMNKLYIYIK